MLFDRRVDLARRAREDVQLEVADPPVLFEPEPDAFTGLQEGFVDVDDPERIQELERKFAFIGGVAPASSAIAEKETLVPKLTIVAHIKAQPDQITLVKSELEKLIAVTRAEAGCLQYDLHQDNENPACFLFYENWESRDLWQAHMGSQHLKDYLAATEGAVAEFALNEMTHIG